MVRELMEDPAVSTLDKIILNFLLHSPKSGLEQARIAKVACIAPLVALARPPAPVCIRLCESDTGVIDGDLSRALYFPHPFGSSPQSPSRV